MPNESIFSRIDRPIFLMKRSIDRAILTHPLRRLWIEAASIVTVALTIALAGNGRSSLWDRDEPRFACAVREMRARGDWITPTFNGEPRYNKPILIYWLMRAATSIAGDGPFGARLVSAVAGTCTCLLVWGLGRRLLGPEAGLLAAFIHATAPIAVVEAKLATADAVLALLIVGCQFCLWELSKRPSRTLAALFWSLAALATLDKGPVGPLLIAAAAVASMLLGGSRTAIKNLYPRFGIPLFVMIVAPWLIAIGVVSHGEFFRVAIAEQFLGRIARGVEKHEGFPGYYAAVSMIAYYPWSAILPAAVVAIWSKRRVRAEAPFLLGWMIGPWILLEIPRTKIIHYYLSSYPAIALIAARLIVDLAADVADLRRRPLGRLSIGLLGGVGIGLAVVIVAAGFVFPDPLKIPCIMIGLIVLVGVVAAMARFQAGRGFAAAWGLVVSWGLATAIAGGWAIPAAEPFRTSRSVAERLSEWSKREKLECVLGSYQEPGIIYTLGEPTRLVRGRDEWITLLRDHKPVVAPLLPLEMSVLRREPELSLDVLETMRIFNFTRAQSDVIQFVRVGRIEKSAANRTKNAQIINN